MKRFRFYSTIISMLIAFIFLLSLALLFNEWIKSPPKNFSSLFAPQFLSTLLTLSTFIAFFVFNKQLNLELANFDYQKIIFDTLTKSKSIGVVLLNFEGEILFANEFAKEFLQLHNQNNANIFNLIAVKNSILDDKSFNEIGETILRKVEIKGEIHKEINTYVKETEFQEESWLLFLFNQHSPETKSETILEALINTIDDGIAILDQNGYLVKCNNSLLNLLECKIEDFKNKKFFDVLINSNLFEGFPKDYLIELKERASMSIEKDKIQILAPNSQKVTFKDNKSRTFVKKYFKIDIGNNDYLFASIISEVTEQQNLIEKLKELNTKLEEKISKKTKELEDSLLQIKQINEELTREIEKRKQIENELRKSQEQYINFINNLPVGVYRTNLKGEILLANPALAKILGCKTLEELKNTSAFEFYETEEKRSMVLQQHKSTQEKLLKVETEMIAKDGRRIVVNDYGCSSSDPITGDIIFDGVIIDVTEKYKIEKEIEKSEKKFRQLFERLNEILFQLNKNAEIELVSPSVHEVLGYSPEELVGKKI